MRTRVEEINEIDALKPLAADWSALLARTSGAFFFQSLDWLRVYWEHFGDSQRLRCLVVIRDGRPRALVPLVVRREQKGPTSMRVLTYPLHDWGSYYGPIGPAAGAALSAAMRHIRRTHRDWDMIDLRWIGEQAAPPTLRAMQQARYRVHEHLWKRTAVIDVSGSWDQYLASRPQKFRSSLRRYARRLAEQGSVTFQRHRPLGRAVGDADPAWEAYDACVALARKSWQGASQDGTTLSHAAVGEFLRAAHAVAADAGAVDMNLLRLNGRLVAFAYNYQWNGSVYGLRVGFDPQYAQAGVGKVLWTRSVQDSFQRRDMRYDIGSESLEVKRNWLTRIEPVRAMAYYPLTAPKGQLVRLARWIRCNRRLDVAQVGA